MASLVSSERAFSQGGITISKCRNCLKGDIVEALQCLKYAIRHDLLFWEVAPSSITEALLDGDEEDRAKIDDNDSVDENVKGWEALFVEEEDDDQSK
jgi:hypothetical protein